MLYESAVALANCVNEEEKAKGQLFPDLTRIRDVSAAVGKAVISTAVAEGLHDPAKVGDAELGGSSCSLKLSPHAQQPFVEELEAYDEVPVP